MVAKCVNPLSAKPAFENEQAKITVSKHLVGFFQFIVLAGTFLAPFSAAKYQLDLILRVVCLLAKPLYSLS